MRKNRKGRPRRHGRILFSDQIGDLWGILVDRGESLVLTFTDTLTSSYVWGTSWQADDIPYPLLLDVRFFMASFLGRAKAAKAAKGKAASVSDPDFCGLYPAIGEYLYATVDEEKKPRQTATLMIFADGGSLKMLLNDRASQQSMWAQGATFDEALADLERRIVDDTSAWRDNQTGKRTK